MTGRHWLFASVVVMAGALAPAIAPAASLAPQTALRATEANSSMVQTVQYRRCSYWRSACGDKYGWGGRAFRYCMARHGC